MGKTKLMLESIINRHYPLTPDDCYVKCPDCNGTGKYMGSECCGASITNGICTDCGEHSEMIKCDACNGTGYMEWSEEDETAKREKALIDNYDLRTDE